MASIALPGLVAIGPIALLLVGLVPSSWANRRPHATARLGGVAAWTAFAAALAAAAALVAFGRIERTFVAVGPIAIGVYFDQLSAIMLLLVSFIGAVVTRYARNYVDGDPQHGRFHKWLALTLAAVLALMISGNLAMFAAAWIAMSLCLHQLLVFYPERPAAQIAARKKFVISRLGDICLIVAMALIWKTFGSLDFNDVFATAKKAAATGAVATEFHLIAALLVISGLLKSAQFPFHGWLPEVMETPTPVSALLHAGIINAGGFLIVRMSDVVALSTPSLNVLAVVGAVTALFGALVMLTQSSVKVWLAHSTIAQMGFMMLQCGLGAFSSAILHIVAHALYKAHAFLASGSVVDLAKSSWSPAATGKPHPLRLIGALVIAVALTFAVGFAFGVSPEAKPGMLVLGAVLLISVTQLMWNSFGEFRTTDVALRGAGLALAVCVAYFVLQIAFERLLAPALPIAHATRGAFDLALLVGVVIAFMGVVVLQTEFPYQAHRPAWRRLFVVLFNGLYVNTIANRIIARIWPVEMSAASKGGK